VGDSLRVLAAPTQAIGQGGKLTRRVLGDADRRPVRAEQVRVCEDGAQDVQWWQGTRRCRLVVGKIAQVEGVDRFHGVGKVGVDLKAVKVADDEERRIFQVFTVLLYLSIGRLEVLMLALVLPREMATHPNIVPSTRATRLARVLLEGVEAAVGVRGCRRRLAKHSAEVEEVLLGGTALGERAALPARDERWDIEAG